MVKCFSLFLAEQSWGEVNFNKCILLRSSSHYLMVSHPINWTTKWWAGALDVSSQHSQTIQTTVEVWNCACGGKLTKEQKISVHTWRPSRGRAATRLCAKFNAGTNISTRNCGIIWFGRNYFKRLVAQTSISFSHYFQNSPQMTDLGSRPSLKWCDLSGYSPGTPPSTHIIIALKWKQYSQHIYNTENRRKFWEETDITSTHISISWC